METKTTRSFRWLITLVILLSSSTAVANYKKAIKYSKASKFDLADIEYERAWKKKPKAYVSYSWCMMLLDAKRYDKARVVCKKVDQGKLKSKQASRVKNALTLLNQQPKAMVLPTEANTTTAVDNSATTNTTNNKCNNGSVCAENGNIAIDNSTRINDIKYENQRLSTVGYVGIASLAVGIGSAFWLNSELSTIDELKLSARSTQSRGQFQAILKNHNDAQLRGQIALGATVLFGLAGTILLTSDIISVERVPITVNLHPTSISLVW